MALQKRHRAAVLIACKNGEATIANTVRSAASQADVYVISDGSADRTAEVAANAGAQVLARSTSGGKPDALRAGNAKFALSQRYDYIAVMDDDTTVAPDYLNLIVGAMDADAGIAVGSGRIESVWNHAQRWNPMIAMRAFMYWSYQVTIKRGQNALRVVNVICGANSVFRADVFAALIEDDAPYAIDDMYWLAEIIRRRLGRVAYVHQARLLDDRSAHLRRLVPANGPLVVGAIPVGARPSARRAGPARQDAPARPALLLVRHRLSGPSR